MSERRRECWKCRGTGAFDPDDSTDGADCPRCDGRGDFPEYDVLVRSADDLRADVARLTAELAAVREERDALRAATKGSGRYDDDDGECGVCGVHVDDCTHKRLRVDAYEAIRERQAKHVDLVNALADVARLTAELAAMVAQAKFDDDLADTNEALVKGLRAELAAVREERDEARKQRQGARDAAAVWEGARGFACIERDTAIARAERAEADRAATRAALRALVAAADAVRGQVAPGDYVVLMDALAAARAALSDGSGDGDDRKDGE